MTGSFLRCAAFGAVALGVSACSMGSAPLVTAFNPPLEEPAKAVPQQPKSDEASAGSSVSGALSGLWDKVAANFQSETPEAIKASKDAAARFDPASAQNLINEYRQRKGLKPLTINAKLTAAAYEHSQDLAKHDRISHYGSDGTDPWARVTRTGYPARLAAENVGTGQLSIQEVFDGWRKSPDHNANLLLRDAREMGIAVVYRPETEFKTFWTLVLGAPDGPVAAAQF
jgi:uncharacterized protein YkwD